MDKNPNTAKIIAKIKAKMPYREIARVFGITKQRVSQIAIANKIRKMRYISRD